MAPRDACACYYEVSSLGRVDVRCVCATWPLRRQYLARTHPQDHFPGHHGYLFIQFVIPKQTSLAGPVHVLIAEAFLKSKPTPRHTVNHVDADKSNNAASNLEWMTPLQQTRHAIEAQRMDPNHLKKYTLHGELHRRAKLTEEIVRVILYAPIRFSSLDLAELFGVSPSQISNIRTHKTWRHVS